MRRELFVGNLVYTMTDESLKELFSEAGNVESAKVIMDRATGKSRGFGFVTMATVEEANASIEKLNNREYGSERRPLRVNYSNADEQRGSGPRPPRPSGNGGGGGSFQRNKPFGSRNQY